MKSLKVQPEIDNFLKGFGAVVVHFILGIRTAPNWSRYIVYLSIEHHLYKKNIYFLETISIVRFFYSAALEESRTFNLLYSIYMVELWGVGFCYITITLLASPYSITFGITNITKNAKFYNFHNSRGNLFCSIRRRVSSNLFSNVCIMWITADANSNSQMLGRAQYDGKLVQTDFYIIFHL